MGPIEIVASKIKSIADAIRDRTGETAPMTLDEMAEAIEYMPGDGGPMETLILVDENGYEMQAFLTEEEVELNATPNDIRIGMTAVTDTGVTTGEKEIPGYITTQGKRGIKVGSRLEIPMYSDKYQFTKLLVIVCDYNTTLLDSVSTTMTVVDGNVYTVGSITPISTATANPEKQSIDLGLVNNGDKMMVMHYTTIKENL